MNMAEYGSWRSQLLGNVNFEPIIRGFKSDIFTETKCKIGFIYVCMIQLQKKKSGVKKWVAKSAIKGGGASNA